MSGLVSFVSEGQRVLLVDVTLDDSSRAALATRVGKADLLVQFDANLPANATQFDVVLVGNTNALP
jgi:pyruvate carboxylase